MAEDKEEKPEGETPAEDASTGSSQDTAVGHSVVEEPGRETAVGHPVVDEGATEVFFSRDEPAAASEPAAAAVEPAPQPAAAPPTPNGGTSPAAADRQAADSHDAFTEKPELFVAGAFVGAFVVAKLLKKLTGGGD